MSPETGKAYCDAPQAPRMPSPKELLLKRAKHLRDGAHAIEKLAEALPDCFGSEDAKHAFENIIFRYLGTMNSSI